MKKICNIINIPLDKNMLNPPQNGSYFKKYEGKKGIPLKGLHRWKLIIKKWELFIINLFLARIIKKYNYDI